MNSLRLELVLFILLVLLVVTDVLSGMDPDHNSQAAVLQKKNKKTLDHPA